MATALARRFRIDVSADGTAWIQLKGVQDFNPQVSPEKKDSGTYDTSGWGASEITMNAWSVEITVLRQSTAGVFDPGQELVRARQAQFGELSRVYVRWYDINGAPEAYTGRAIVEWNRSQTNYTDLDAAKATLTGDGALTTIANPGVAPAIPVITAATPTAQTVGKVVVITGAGFTGTVVTTGVKFNAVNASSWIVVNDNQISAVMPAGSAGVGDIIVTNAVGASTPAFPYTRGV